MLFLLFFFFVRQMHVLHSVVGFLDLSVWFDILSWWIAWFVVVSNRQQQQHNINISRFIDLLFSLSVLSFDFTNSSTISMIVPIEIWIWWNNDTSTFELNHSDFFYRRFQIFFFLVWISLLPFLSGVLLKVHWYWDNLLNLVTLIQMFWDQPFRYLSLWANRVSLVWVPSLSISFNPNCCLQKVSSIDHFDVLFDMWFLVEFASLICCGRISCRLCS
jgi:hypothetical protein